MGSNNDGKVTDNPATPMTPSTSFTTVMSMSGSSTSSISTPVSLNIGISAGSNIVQSTSNLANKKAIFNTSEQSVQPEPQLNFHGSNAMTSESENEQKSENKTPLIEELQPSLDTGKIKSLVEEM